MSHEPPVPQGNQSPFPLREPPHPKSPPQPSARETAKPADRRTAGVVIGVAAIVAAGAGVAALLTTRNRGEEDGASPRRSRAKKEDTDASRTPAAKRKPAKAKSSAAAPKRKSAPSDNPAIRGARDAAHIAMTEAHEVAYWSRKFGVDRAQLQAAVDQVGHGTKAVAAFFAARKGDDEA